MMAAATFPHCKHCAWGNPHHPDDNPGHTQPCPNGCDGPPS